MQASLRCLIQIGASCSTELQQAAILCNRNAAKTAHCSHSSSGAFKRHVVIEVAMHCGQEQEPGAGQALA